MTRQIYLDYAAATSVDDEVMKAMQPYFSADFYNPSAGYLAARNVRRNLEQARADVAGCLGARPSEIIFTAGATEANNLAIQGMMSQFPDGEALVSTIEHDSVIEPAGLFKSREIPVDKKGRIILDESSNLLTDKTVLVSVGYVNNEIGCVQPLSEIAELIARVRDQRRRQKNPLPIYLHTDAAQAPNLFDIHVSRLKIDLMSLNGGKIYGPKQSGALYVRTGVKLKPLIVGGRQEFNLRSGTENVPASIGLAAALNSAQNQRKVEADRLGKLRSLFVSQIEENFPAAMVNSSSKGGSPHIISVTFPGYDNERLMMELDELGVQVATGSACAAGSQQPSHVLAAIGLSDEQARSTLRFSIGRQTTEDHIRRTIKALRQVASD